MDAIDRAIHVVGGAKELARQVGLSAQFLSQIRRGHRKMPVEHCHKIEAATGGQVRCEDLRPDMAEMWAALRGTSSAAPQSAGGAA